MTHDSEQQDKVFAMLDKDSETLIKVLRDDLKWNHRQAIVICLGVAAIIWAQNNEDPEERKFYRSILRSILRRFPK
jgi:hypothetical protein